MFVFVQILLLLLTLHTAFRIFDLSNSGQDIWVWLPRVFEAASYGPGWHALFVFLLILLIILFFWRGTRISYLKNEVEVRDHRIQQFRDAREYDIRQKDDYRNKLSQANKKISEQDTEIIRLKKEGQNKPKEGDPLDLKATLADFLSRLVEMERAVLLAEPQIKAVDANKEQFDSLLARAKDLNARVSALLATSGEVSGIIGTISSSIDKLQGFKGGENFEFRLGVLNRNVDDAERFANEVLEPNLAKLRDLRTRIANMGLDEKVKAFNDIAQDLDRIRGLALNKSVSLIDMKALASSLEKVLEGLKQFREDLDDDAPDAGLGYNFGFDHSSLVSIMQALPDSLIKSELKKLSDDMDSFWDRLVEGPPDDEDHENYDRLETRFEVLIDSLRGN